MKVEFATNPRVKFQDGVPVEIEFTVPAGLPMSYIRCGANPETTGKRADMALSLRRADSPQILATEEFNMHGTGFSNIMAVPWEAGDHVLTVTASNVTGGAFGCTVEVSGRKKAPPKPPRRAGGTTRTGTRK